MQPIGTPLPFSLSSCQGHGWIYAWEYEGSPLYVGKSDPVVEGIAKDANFPVERFKDHPTVACRDRTGFIRTLRDLLADGLSPRMVILESGVPPSRLADREIEWIALLFTLGYELDNFLTSPIAKKQELFERDLGGRPSLRRSWKRIVEELLEQGRSRTISAEKASEFRQRLVERFALNPWEGELPSWTKRQ